MKRTPLEPFQVAALSRTLDACPDPVALYRALASDRADTALLESADRAGGRSDKSLVLSRAALAIRCRDRRVDIAALSPNGASLLDPLATRLAARAALSRSDDGLTLRFAPPPAGSERERLLAPNVLDAVRAAVLGLERVGGETRPPLVLGSIAYDLLGAYESLPDGDQDDPLGWPDYELWLAEELCVVHHDRRKLTLLRYVYGGSGAAAAYHDADRALADAVAAVARVPEHSERPATAAPPAATPRIDVDDDAFAALVTRLKAHIVDGDVFQIVPSRTFALPCADPLAAYTALRALNPSPYMFYLRGRAGTLFGASPESALTAAGTPRRVTISPLAGTRPRGSDDDADARIEAELRLDDKEVAEHMMLVDLARNDVARVSLPGTRKVDALLEVVRYSHVMHLRSLVSGVLRPDLDALHAYVATMNMGTLVGAPKIEAARLLRRYERTRRGPYGGAVGYLDAGGELDSCIVIRSAAVVDGIAYVRAGCGVVYDSDPAGEADETRRKADAVLLALRLAQGST